MLLYVVLLLACMVAALGAYVTYSLSNVVQKLGGGLSGDASPPAKRYPCVSDAPATARAPLAATQDVLGCVHVERVLIHDPCLTTAPFVVGFHNSVESASRERRTRTSQHEHRPSRVAAPAIGDPSPRVSAVRVPFVSYPLFPTALALLRAHTLCAACRPVAQLPVPTPPPARSRSLTRTSSVDGVPPRVSSGSRIGPAPTQMRRRGHDATVQTPVRPQR